MPSFLAILYKVELFMNVEELVKKLEAQEAEIQSLRNELTKALESLTQANTRIKQLEGQAAKDSHNSGKPPSSDGFKEPLRKTKSLRGKSQGNRI